MAGNEKKQKRRRRKAEEKQDSTQKLRISHKDSSRAAVAGKNREFAVVTYFFLALFLCLIGYFAYFQVALSEDFIDSPYNKRLEQFEQTIVRGSIYAADGEVLAETVTDEDGTETRNYPYGSVFAHVVGYSNSGQTGIESIANFSLLRSNVSAAEKIVDELQSEKSPGDSVVTTLSALLQQTAYDALGDYKGAIVVMEPATGKILAMVSKPDYDPNTIAEDWDMLTAEDNDESQLLNRATQGLYPPGSTFKIFTTLEYIHEHSDYEEYEFDCNGAFTVDSSTIHCYGGSSHGSQSLMESFANSCNTSYASIGLELNITQFASLCDDLLFNSSLPTEFAYNKSSFVLSEEDGTSAVMETAIGQGKTLVTPFHMALITCAIANDGVLMTPYVIDRVENENGAVVEQYEPTVYSELLSAEDASVLQEFMHEVVETGTGKKLNGQSYEAYGKTGSAEFSTGSDSSHSWFIGYAHREGKEDIAVSVIVEDSGSGSEYALPMAKEIFDAYYQD